MDDILKTLKQEKPFRSREEGVYLAIQIVADEQRAKFNELFKTRDLTGTQYNVLRILRGSGDRGLSCSEISERMINRDSDITRMLDRLETRGLIRRERQTDDRRVVLSFLAEAGSALLADLDDDVAVLHSSLLGHMTKAELDQLSGLLAKTRKKL